MTKEGLVFELYAQAIRRTGLSWWRELWFQTLLVAALGLTLNLAGNGRASLWDRDEPRFAGCTREMRDWILPTFNGEPRYHKPILIYWLMRAGFALGGDNPFGARLVSSIAGAGTCLLVLGMGRRMFGPRIGLMAALMYATAPLVVVESKLATTDATLTFFLLAAQFLLWELNKGPSRLLSSLFWVVLGLATLTKGPIGPLLIASSGLLCWWLGGPTESFRNLGVKRGLLCFALVTAPWYIAVGVFSHGDFYRYAIGKQLGERVMTQMEEHGGFPGYYLVTSLVTFHPWSALLPAAFYVAWKRRSERKDLAFLLGWAIGPLILLECIRTKLVHYYLPAFPACALLVAYFVDSLAMEGANLRRWPLGRLSLGLLAGIGIGMSCCVGAAATLTSEARWPCLAISLILAVGTLWGVRRFQREDVFPAFRGLAASWGAAMFLVGVWLAPSLEPYRASHIVGRRLAAIAREHRSEPILLSFQEPTIIYSMGRHAAEIRSWHNVDELLDRHGVLVSAINPSEHKAILNRPDLDVEVLESLDAFNLSKGKTENIRFALIRRKAPALRDDAFQLSRFPDEQALVK